MNLRPLPSDAQRLCDELHAPPRLVLHLTLVHDVAAELLDAFAKEFPSLELEREAVLFGASTHDLGKVVHPNELTGPGVEHEADGPALLERHGVPEHLARFARTDARWSQRGESIGLEDMIVALADAVWKGERHADLESALVQRLAVQQNLKEWDVFAKLDNLVNVVTSRAAERLARALSATGSNRQDPRC